MTDAARKIAVIVALDVAGYSARTEADEAKTTAEVAALRHVIEGIATAHGGRVFNTAGDGFMLEFASSLAAVEAAQDLAQKCEPRVRVGVHLGDVVVQPNGDLLGHGVNVAARLMARSDPGSALISADVRRTIRGPLAERLVSRGVLQLDKMAEAIEAFALDAASTALAPATPKSAETLLAVLPFDNLSNDPDMQFFSDGVSEEILQALCHSSGLRVIGRTSAFQFRGARKAEAAQMLRATHILDGAVRKSGARLRISAQLTDAIGGAAIWSDRYDRDIAEVFSLQDDIAASVALALRSILTRARRDQRVDPYAYELYLRGLELFLSQDDRDVRSAAALFEEVVARDPEFADGWASLGGARAALLPRSEDSVGTQQHQAALAAVRRASALDSNCVRTYRIMAILKPAFAEHAEKVRLAEKAMELAPNDPRSLTTIAGALSVVGRVTESAAHIVRAASLEPLSPFIAGMASGALLAIGRRDEAMSMIDAAVKRLPPSEYLTTVKFALLQDLGRIDEAVELLESARGSVLDDTTVSQWRFVLMLPSLSKEQREPILRAILEPATNPILWITLCQIAAEFGMADLAYERLFEALDKNRPIGSYQSVHSGINRSNTASTLFFSLGKALRADKRFATLCAKCGLVDYWRSSGHWPDCADEVPYDFKAECEKAARELAKA